MARKFRRVSLRSRCVGQKARQITRVYIPINDKFRWTKKVKKIVLTQIFSGLNLIKQLFHSRLVGYEVKIANLALRASSAIYHLISNVRSWINC